MNDHPDSSLQPSLWEALRDRQKVIQSDLVVNALLDLKKQVDWLQIELTPSELQARSNLFDKIQPVETMIDRVNKLGGLVARANGLGGLVARSHPNNMPFSHIESELKKLHSELTKLRDKLLY